MQVAAEGNRCPKSQCLATPPIDVSAEYHYPQMQWHGSDQSSKQQFNTALNMNISSISSTQLSVSTIVLLSTIHICHDVIP